MLNIRGVYEVAIRVRDVAIAEAFYRDVLGFEVGLRDERRNWVFMRAGPEGMIVLQEDKGEWPLQHFAFTVGERDIDAAVAELGRRGLTLEGPMVHEWIPAKSLYFRDPDGHHLELCAPLRR
jgi:lactoylglutathione lyase